MGLPLESQVSSLRDVMELGNRELKADIVALKREVATLRAELAKTRAYAPVPRPAVAVDANGVPTDAGMDVLRASEAPALLKDLMGVGDSLEKELLAVTKYAKALSERVIALESRRLDLYRGLLGRMDAMERRCLIEYQGVWLESKEYPAGAAVTLAGSLWVAEVAPIAGDRQGSGNGSGWRLAVKNRYTAR
jgi:hypothetical protein